MKTWKFNIGGEINGFSTGGRFTVQSSVLLVPPLLAGQGIARVPKFIVQQYLVSGDLVTLLDGYQANNAELYAVYVSRSDKDPVVNRLFDFVQNRL